MYKHTHIYIFTYLHTYILTYIHTYIHTYICIIKYIYIAFDFISCPRLRWSHRSKGGCRELRSSDACTLNPGVFWGKTLWVP